jgi:hypothetical protein
MERRGRDRVPASFKLLIIKGGLPVAIARVKDASDMGLFIETEFTDMAPQQAMQFELPLRVNSILCPFRFAAQVVHQSQKGYGLVIDSADQHARLTLLRLRDYCIDGRAVSASRWSAG